MKTFSGMSKDNPKLTRNNSLPSGDFIRSRLDHLGHRLSLDGVTNLKGLTPVMKTPNKNIKSPNKSDVRKTGVKPKHARS